MAKSLRKRFSEPINIGNCRDVNIKVIELPSLKENTNLIKVIDSDCYIDISSILDKTGIESIRITFEKSIEKEYLERLVNVRITKNPRPDIDNERIAHEIVAVADPNPIIDYVDNFMIDITYKIYVGYIHL